MECPVKKAIAEIKEGGYYKEDRPSPVVIGSGSAKKELVGGFAASRAMALSLELARAKMEGQLYNGDLLRFLGQDYNFALCYLIDSKYNILIDQICQLIQKFDTNITPQLCLLSPSYLHSSINNIINEEGVLGVELLDPPTVKFPSGFFNPERTIANLENILKKLLDLSKIVDEIELYHLSAAKKIEEILSRKSQSA